MNHKRNQREIKEYFEMKLKAIIEIHIIENNDVQNQLSNFY